MDKIYQQKEKKKNTKTLQFSEFFKVSTFSKRAHGALLRGKANKTHKKLNGTRLFFTLLLLLLLLSLFSGQYKAECIFLRRASFQATDV